jgi:folate-binding protein YgfZ
VTVAVPSAQIDAYRAAREAAAWVDLSERELLRVTGPDRVSFVQGMVTNDVEKLDEGGSVYAALLNPKGGMMGDLRVLRLGDALVLDTGKGFGASVKGFLSKYLISEDAELADAPELAVVGLLGPKAEASAVASKLASLPGLVGGIDVLVAREALAPLSLPKLDEATYEVLRVEAGVPKYGLDMTEATIPLEANLAKALHYQKGCYIGQEVIARATYRGHMNKKLSGLLLGDAEPAAGTELKRGDRKVGFITSVVRSVGRGQNVALGYVHRDAGEAGTELDAAGSTAVVAALPLVP